VAWLPLWATWTSLSLELDLRSFSALASLPCSSSVYKNDCRRFIKDLPVWPRVLLSGHHAPRADSQPQVLFPSLTIPFLDVLRRPLSTRVGGCCFGCLRARIMVKSSGFHGQSSVLNRKDWVRTIDCGLGIWHMHELLSPYLYKMASNPPSRTGPFRSQSCTCATTGHLFMPTQHDTKKMSYFQRLQKPRVRPSMSGVCTWMSATTQASRVDAHHPSIQQNTTVSAE
jgi:hypothetical protein